MTPDMASRYGLGPSQPNRTAQQPNIRGSILDEKLLKVTLTLESVRLLKGEMPVLAEE